MKRLPDSAIKNIMWWFLAACLGVASAQLPASDDVPRLWPAPVSVNRAFKGADPNLVATASTFHVEHASGDDVLAWNVAFYTREIFFKGTGAATNGAAGDMPLDLLTVSVAAASSGVPALGADESYELRVASPNATLTANTTWGAIRGLETFSQLFAMNQPGTIVGGAGGAVVIRDAPAYAWRGVMVDTARHHIPVADLNRTVDALAQNKLNVLHLHLTDGESFNVDTSKWAKFPGLSAGAFAPAATYTADDLRAVVERGRLRGVRVVPEFDLPAHMASWARAYDDLITDCPSENPHPEWPRYYSPADVTNPRLYEAIAEILSELGTVFPDAFWHVGGDETQTNCWTANANVSAYMKAHDLDVNQLYAEFETRYAKLVAGVGKKVVGWAEIFSTPATAPPEDAVIHVWHGNDEVAAVVAAGYRGIVSSNWYLDDAGTPADQWPDYYKDDPRSYVAKNATAAQRALVIGGEAAMWNSAFDATNMDTTVWPNAAAMAERLWSPALEDVDAARTRLSQHRCRMVRRGTRAAPLAEDFCSADLYVRKSKTYYYTGDFPPSPETPPP